MGGGARREESSVREERKKEEEGGGGAIHRRTSASLAPYCVTRAPATLVPFFPHGTTLRSRWIHRAPLSLSHY
jgi:hypothetical protein